ncbi:hypothetical protein [Paenibacillus sp. B2(2019)]|uniref:hypothetical protein n=1 Tax=Paenibacillus sp. B2(2019) TaxID=2607754 RepID=UPI00165F732A
MERCDTKNRRRSIITLVRMGTTALREQRASRSPPWIGQEGNLELRELRECAR